MQLQQILDFVDKHKESYDAPGSYRVLNLPTLSIIVEHAGIRTVKITDATNGDLLFIGSARGISTITEGDWQVALQEYMAEPTEEKVERLPLTVEGTTGAETVGQEGNLVPPTEEKVVKIAAVNNVNEGVTPAVVAGTDVKEEPTHDKVLSIDEALKQEIFPTHEPTVAEKKNKNKNEGLVLRKYFIEHGFDTLLAINKEECLLYIFAHPAEVDNLYDKFLPLSTGEEVEDKELLKILLEQVQDESFDKTLTAKFFFVYLKYLVNDKNNIIKLQTKNQILFIRKVGDIFMESQEYVFQNCGDNKGMVVWNITPITSIIKICD